MAIRRYGRYHKNTSENLRKLMRKKIFEYLIKCLSLQLVTQKQLRLDSSRNLKNEFKFYPS